ncbi:hypothetical protein LSAT2_023641 [Lamellibrachia satsuma]|nr:hypothetical protein LSAT2_023641 [Lamellibrachia satsuma]
MVLAGCHGRDVVIGRRNISSAGLGNTVSSGVARTLSNALLTYPPDQRHIIAASFTPLASPDREDVTRFVRNYFFRRAQCRVFTVQQHKHTDDQYPGHNCTSKMASVRCLFVLCLVCLLLCQMMSLSEACSKKTCHSKVCGTYCCASGQICRNCNCYDFIGLSYGKRKC